MKLIFVRHGETDWNKEKKLMGQTDIPLNDEGIAQAKAVAETLGGDFDALYSSPLKRAQQTAEIIAERLKKPIQVRKELAERSFGSLSGKTWEEIAATAKRDMKTETKEEQYDFRPWGGESAEDVKARLLGFLAELKTQPYKKVLIVCHSGVISMMRHVFPESEISGGSHISNASVYEFEI